jgi:hypothetical protein
MTRNAFLVPCLIGHFCFGGAPVIAQQNATPAGEWKAFLPSKSDSRLTGSDNAVAAAPELVRIDPGGDETLRPDRDQLVH